MRTERLQALCDGVFAIAMTLLVLELPVPEGSADLAHDLLDGWPSYAAYVVSFVTLGIVWINHHVLMDGIQRADRALLELNLLLLLFVAVVPWPTGLLAEYVRHDEQATTAAVVYGAVMTLMAAAFTLIRLYLQRQQDLAHTAAQPHLHAALGRSLVGPLVYLTGTVIALVSAVAAFAIFAGAPLFFALSGRTSRVSPDP